MATKRKLHQKKETNLTTFEESLGNFLLRCNAKNLSKETISWYELTLRLLKEFLEDNNLPTTPSMITADHVREYIAELLDEERSPVTINGKLRAFNVFFKHLKENCYLNHNIIEEIDKLQEHRTIIKTFSPSQLKLILEQPDKKTFTGLRDYTILLTFIDTGIRLGGLLGLKVKDVNLEFNYFTVVEKGNKERVVPIGERLSLAIKDYLEAANLKADNYLFCSVYDNKLDKRSLQERITNYGKQAGIKGIRVSPHTFRHTFAKYYLMNGGNIFDLQKILGHTSLEMVKKYLNLLDEDIREQHKKYSPLDSLLPNKRHKTLT